MCGIIGYTGTENAVDLLLDGLQALEYRGYDSAGIAVFREDGIEVVKSMGKLENMRRLVKKKGSDFTSHCGIGHTRWATHGKPCDVNSHPHGTDHLFLVHNGIIENYMELKEKLIAEEHALFVSETDTEVAAKLIDSFYLKTKDPFQSIVKATNLLKGSYAFGIVFHAYPGTIFAVRKDSPLICASDESGNFIASDIPAVLKRTNRYYTLAEGEICVMTADRIEFFDFEHRPLRKEEKLAEWDVQAAEKGNYPHFMLKEIMEEPDVVQKTLSRHVKDGLPDLKAGGMTDADLASFKRIVFVACGTAMHAAMVGKAVIEKLARIPVTVEIASEFRYNDPILTPKDLVAAISQSGETADTLAAVRLAKEKGCKTFGIVNVIGSSIARECDWVMETLAGPEIAVASTKAYSAQVSALYLFALKLALIRRPKLEPEIRAYTKELVTQIPFFISAIAGESSKVRYVAESFKDARDLFFIGRGIDYSLSMEGSLKLKEISYIHSEAYAAGEMKHGTISLITEGTPVIAIATQDSVYEKVISNIKEVKARGAKIILITKYGAPGAENVADRSFYLPHCSEIFMPLIAIPVMQLFAYHVSVLRGCDVDKPRNLAKSVTVE